MVGWQVGKMRGWCAGRVGMGKLYCEGKGIEKDAVVEGEAASIARGMGGWETDMQTNLSFYNEEGWPAPRRSSIRQDPRTRTRLAMRLEPTHDSLKHTVLRT